MYTLHEWLYLDDQTVAEAVAPHISTAVIYLNGTRRWFLTQSKNWADYAKLTAAAQRRLNQRFYDHGIRTLIQPLLGYDLLDRGPDYLTLAVEQGLAELATPDYLGWLHQEQIRVTFYGNWVSMLSERGFASVVEELQQVVKETAHYTKHKLLFGLFADEGLDNIVTLAKQVESGEGLLRHYYGQPVDPVDLVIGSGQPGIWDVPLLDINKASLYFLQAPTFFLDKATLREVLYDYLYQRVNDDDLYEDISVQAWQGLRVLGLGQQSQQGWVAA